MAFVNFSPPLISCFNYISNLKMVIYRENIILEAGQSIEQMNGDRLKAVYCILSTRRLNVVNSASGNVGRGGSGKRGKLMNSY